MSTEDSPESTHGTKFIEPSSAREEARVLLVPTREGTSEGVTTASAEPVIIILHEFPIVVIEPSGPPPSYNVPRHQSVDTKIEERRCTP